ncbi:hypothetical protein [Sphingobacterium chuzhouense]|uniref:DUF2116 family Zn-ribbon domain-containing protein n=1 Tax=Sphingobacterium chuzhouense TaxID=1742264 RepID=A0ABR7XQH0_9SPHI|nr:hypothetical protein [Sphingobacterium chuzhouense]MBD1421400.1 hypothetical protein [Sphingobacterium chuzhouense]
MEKRMCLACGEPVVGRSDKRFCHDACRNAYNNKRNSLPNSFVRKINDILKRNRQVLGKVLGKEKMQKVTRERLLSKGFDFDFFTNQFSNAKGQIYFFVYEYGYLPLDEEVFLIVRQKTSEQV